MTPEMVEDAARTLWQTWQEGRHLGEGLPAAQRPQTREQGYAVQAAIQRLSGQGVFGWKIAATSAAGQQHIGVDGPLAGRLLSGRIRDEGRSVPLAGNIMGVAEAEFAFRLARDLPPRGRDYSEDEVMAAVGALYPAIEIPDSRYQDFVKVGAAQLIADNACACYFVLGRECRADWRRLDFKTHAVKAYRNGEQVREGSGANVLGDPRLAMTWIANELARFEQGLKAGQVVTTGTCVVPWPIAAGDKLRADFGILGAVECTVAHSG